MKKLLTSVIIISISILFTACSDSSTGEDNNRDTTPPEVVSTYPPADPPKEVSVLNSIEIEFSEPVDCSSVDNSMIDVGIHGTGTITCDGNRVIYDPEYAFNFAVLIQVTVKAGIKDMAGNAMVDDYIFQFCTEVDP